MVSMKRDHKFRLRDTLNPFLLSHHSAECLERLFRELVCKSCLCVETVLDHLDQYQMQMAVHSNADDSNLVLEAIRLLCDDESECMTMYASVSSLNLLHPDARVRAMCSKLLKIYEEHRLKVFNNRDLYNALRLIRDRMNDGLIDRSVLCAVQFRFLDRWVRDFERNGAQIDNDETRQRIVAGKKRIADLQLEFQQNLASADNTVMYFTKEELSGLSREYLETLQTMEVCDRLERVTKYAVTLKFPELVPLLRTAEDPQVRRKADTANARKCQAVNEPIFEEVIQLRHEVAQLLGYKHHADYVLSVKMAKNLEDVLGFLTSLKDGLTPLAKREMVQLLKYKRRECEDRGLPFDDVIRSWDFSYYCNLKRKKEQNVHETVIRNYFPLDDTLRRVFDMLGDMFHVRIMELNVGDLKEEGQLHLWHEEVRMFSMFDGESEELMGHFLLDIFPRANKFTHSAAFVLQPTFVYGSQDAGDKRLSRQVPIVCIVANFSRHASDKPPLLKHYELKTLLHECGHMMHNLCSRSPIARFSGTNVEKDFSELPSQLMENWCWNRDGLRRLSRHFETGEPLPEHMIDKLLRSKNDDIGLLTLQRIHLAMFDLVCHSSMPLRSISSGKLYAELRRSIAMLGIPKGTNPAASFNHLMRRYDAGYYGYLYSQVFAADVYQCFIQSGNVFSPELGRRFRSTILELGGTKDGEDMLRDFLGREPSRQPFLESLLLVEDHDAEPSSPICGRTKPMFDFDIPSD